MSREELNALAEEIADRLGVDPETVMTEPPRRLSLTIEQVRGIMAPEKLWVLIIEHRHGVDGSVHRSKDDAEGNLFAWVTQFWAQDGPKGAMPNLPDEAIQAYFDFADESYMLSEAELPKGRA